ncbi:MAG: 23S rRNA (guanosine(2251)-2'-O)-methyltransferase RlmB [Saprospiraceae bacterium]|nr:23S rRNA (guanosine(2251)-2'-O)-methyltransferase RlmB [Saprospiraceae bacterium]
MEVKDTFIIGRKPVIDALNASRALEKVWIDNNLKGELEQDVRRMTRSLKIPLQYVPKAKLNSLVKNSNHQGLVALMPLVDYLSIEDVLPHIFESGKTPLILVLDGVEDVRNIGALARSAVWFGVDAILVSIKRTARFNSFAYKSSAGALNDITVCREISLTKSVQYLKDCGLKIAVADGKGTSQGHETIFSEPLALILGSEEKGVVREIAELADVFIRIEGTEKVESLNVSVAGAILLNEIFKIRNVR